MNESLLFTIAEVAITLAGFSGIAASFRSSREWSPTELRVLWLLLADSLLATTFALLPPALLLLGWAETLAARTCSVALGGWLISGALLALLAKQREEGADRSIGVAAFRYAFAGVFCASVVFGGLLLANAAGLTAFDAHGLYAVGLVLLVLFASIEFMFFVGVLARSGR